MKFTSLFVVAALVSNSEQTNMKQVVAENLNKEANCYPGGCGATTTTWTAPVMPMPSCGGGCPAGAPAAAPAAAAGGDSATKIKKELEKAEDKKENEKQKDEIKKAIKSAVKSIKEETKKTKEMPLLRKSRMPPRRPP